MAGRRQEKMVVCFNFLNYYAFFLTKSHNFVNVKSVERNLDAKYDSSYDEDIVLLMDNIYLSS